MKKNKRTKRPTIAEIQDELVWLRFRRSRWLGLCYVLVISLVAAAMLIIATNLWFPVLRVVGTSMQPLLKDEDVILCLSAQKNIDRGDVIAFYHNDKILLRRVVGIPGDRIEIDSSGTVSVNGEEQLETYANVLSLEPCDIVFPVEVPEDSYFVLGDQRTTSLDSRSDSVGMIGTDQLIGKALFRVWPVDTFKSLQ